RSTLPTWTPDSSRVRWIRAGYEVVARPTEEGESLALTLVPTPSRATAEWPIATVPAPAYQLIPLDAPPVSAALHDALSRAFDASSTLDGVVTAVSRRQAAPRGPGHARRVVFRTADRRLSRPMDAALRSRGRAHD
ncbi:MAG: hypothetical protein ABMA00_13585, partial [Gemmatimonas sp.]